MGGFLPSLDAAPTSGACVRVFKELVDRCAFDSRYNSGGANVVTMPGQNTRGVAIDGSIARFAFAPQVLTSGRREGAFAA